MHKNGQRSTIENVVILSGGRQPGVEGSWQHKVVDVTCANRRWLLPTRFDCEDPSTPLTLRSG